MKDTRTGKVLAQAVTAISPDKPYNVEVAPDAGATVYDLHLAVYDSRGKLRIELQQQRPQTVALPAGQKDPGDPAAMRQDELYHSGEWLDKFRRTGEGLAYYREALKKDPGDARVNLEMGFLALKQGEWNKALEYLDRAQARDGDNSRVWFGKALANAGLRKFKEAYDLFYRASYTYDYHSAAT